MKKIISYIIILLLIAANAYTVWFFRQKIQLREAKIADAAVKSSGGEYHLDKKIRNFELFSKDCFISFSGNNGFSVGVNYPGKDFFWVEHEGSYVFIYDGVFCVDFNKDLVFDFFRLKEKYFIVVDRERFEVNKPDFKTMQAAAPAGQRYHWNGRLWIKKKAAPNGAAKEFVF